MQNIKLSANMQVNQMLNQYPVSDRGAYLQFVAKLQLTCTLRGSPGSPIHSFVSSSCTVDIEHRKATTPVELILEDFLRCHGPEAVTQIRACQRAVDSDALLNRGNVIESDSET